MLKFTFIVNFHPQEEFHLYSFTRCPQSPAWGRLLIFSVKCLTQGTVYPGIILVSGVPSGYSPQIFSHSSRCHSTHSSHCSLGPGTPAQGRASMNKRNTSEWLWDVKGRPIPAWGATAVTWDLVAKGTNGAWLIGWASVTEHLDAIWPYCSFNGSRFQFLTLWISI